jgi:hypothetical protein
MPSRADQKFCRELPDRDKCRREYYRYGSSYGPLREGLHKAIDKKCAELARETDRRLRDIVDGCNVLARRVESLEKVMTTLLNAFPPIPIPGLQTVERAKYDARTRSR